MVAGSNRAIDDTNRLSVQKLTQATPVTPDDRLNPVVINAGVDAVALGVSILARQACPARKKES